MSIVAVFLPVALMPGISGQFFKSFGYTVVISVMMSLFVARMITPLIAAYFLKSHGVQPHASGKWMETLSGGAQMDASTRARRRRCWRRCRMSGGDSGIIWSLALSSLLLLVAFVVGAMAAWQADRRRRPAVDDQPGRRDRCRRGRSSTACQAASACIVRKAGRGYSRLAPGAGGARCTTTASGWSAPAS